MDKTLHNLTPKKRLAVESLGSGLSIGKVAEIVNVSRQTVYTWAQDDQFKRALRERQNEMLGRLSLKLIAISERALEILELALNSPRDAVRVRAASVILSRVTDIIAVADINERLDKLENSVRGQNVN